MHLQKLSDVAMNVTFVRRMTNKTDVKWRRRKEELKGALDVSKPLPFNISAALSSRLHHAAQIKKVMGFLGYLTPACGQGWLTKQDGSRRLKRKWNE